MTSARYTYKYDNFDMSVSMKREGGAVDGTYPASYVGIRMGSSVTSSAYYWYSGYIFGYTNLGNYSIWLMKTNGSAVVIQPWTFSSTINKQDWNTLRVVANENIMNFYINGTLVYTLDDDTYDSGYVGVEMFRPGSTASRLWVDYVTLTHTDGSTSEGLSAEQASQNSQAFGGQTVGSIEGYPE